MQVPRPRTMIHIGDLVADRRCVFCAGRLIATWPGFAEYNWASRAPGAELYFRRVNICLRCGAHLCL